jgi:hypothetical protein
MNNERISPHYIPQKTQYQEAEKLKPGEDFPGEFNEHHQDKGTSATRKVRTGNKYCQAPISYDP